MATVALYARASGNILWSQRDSETLKVTLEMGDRALARRGLSAETHGVIVVEPTISPAAIKGMKVSNDETSIIERTSSIDEFKEKALTQLSAIYKIVSSGADPVSGKDIYVDCPTTNSGTIRMNAGETAATRMAFGYMFATGSGMEYMAEVKDFYNVRHGVDDGTSPVPIADANEIRLKQGADALSYWQHKSQLEKEIKGAKTTEEVKSIAISFDVNVE